MAQFLQKYTLRFDQYYQMLHLHRMYRQRKQVRVHF